VLAIDKIFDYEIFNLARGQSMELTKYIEELEKCLGKIAEKNMMPIQPGDVPSTRADISKAKEMLGYEPSISINEGVKKFVDWYRGYYGK
jgi:UDP-glucuronate 4-epimerase